MIEKEVEFLRESNAIEREYSAKALEDSIKAWQYALNGMKFSGNFGTEMILGVHRRLMTNLNPNIAGKIRNCEVSVGGQMGMKATKVHMALGEWCKLPFKTEADIKKLHIKFEKIHPFEDGNGRTGRILMNWQRLRIGLPILVIRSGTEQYEYYRWFL